MKKIKNKLKLREIPDEHFVIINGKYYVDKKWLENDKKTKEK